MIRRVALIVLGCAVGVSAAAPAEALCGFYVAPAQDAFMCRLRFPAGVVTSAQLRGLANLSLDHAGGYADVTTRANLQLREIGPRHTVPLLMGLADLGIIPKGAGADNIRNITASPTAGQ